MDLVGQALVGLQRLLSMASSLHDGDVFRRSLAAHINDTVFRFHHQMVTQQQKKSDAFLVEALTAAVMICRRLLRLSTDISVNFTHSKFL